MPMAGAPEQVETAAADLARAAGGFAAVGDGVRTAGEGLGGSWSGPAADAARGDLTRLLGNVSAPADSLRGLGPALTTYAQALREAQQLHDQGEALVERATTSRFAEVGAPASASQSALIDVAERALADGHALQQQALEKQRVANEAAAVAVRAATQTLADSAPAGPAPDPGPVVSTGRLAPAAAPGLLPELGNAAASTGNAVLHHPGELAAVLGGGALAAVGAVGALASAPLTASVIGAPAGIPLGAASAAGIVAGVGIAGAGALSLAQHATTDDRVAPFQVDQRIPVEGPAPYPPPEEITGRTQHGEEQAQTRDGHGVSDAAMEDAVERPVAEPEYDVDRDTYLYLGKDASVVLNEQGEVVTTWPRNSLGYRRP